MSLRTIGLGRFADGISSGTAPLVVTGGNASITPATSAAPGSLSASDKAKLDAIAQTNTAPFLQPL